LASNNASPRCPRSPKAVFKTGRWVDEMVGVNEAIRTVLVRKVLDAAAQH
jgi:hypothetical protein